MVFLTFLTTAKELCGHLQEPFRQDGAVAGTSLTIKKQCSNKQLTLKQR